MTDFRALCAKVLAYNEGRDNYNFSHLKDYDRDNAAFDAWQEIKAELKSALSQPEPEGPTDEEIMDLMPQEMHADLAAAARAMTEQAGTDSTRVKGLHRIILNRHAVDLARAVLDRWGNHPESPDSSSTPS